MHRITFSRIVVACMVPLLYESSIILCASIYQGVEICTLCRCTESKSDAIIDIQCFGDKVKNDQPLLFVDLSNAVWPLTGHGNGEPAKIRVYFKDMEWQYLPRVTINANIVELNMDSVGIKTISKDSFSSIKNLTTLRITNNDLSTLEYDFFTRVLNLEYLDLSNNNLISVKALERASLSALRTIDLSNNKLKTISDRLMSTLRAVSVVRVSNCELYSFETKTAPEWKSLDISWNKLRVVSADTFRNLENLEILDLSHNEVAILDPQAFAFLPALKIVDLSYNSISNLEGNLVLPATLYSMYMGSNGMEAWPFHDIPPALDVLAIQDNKLGDLMLNQPLNISSLNASGNRLETFPGSLFPEIVELDLSFNLLTEFPRYLGLHLESLNLDGNIMDHIFVKDKTSLKQLSISRMPNLVEIGPGSFSKLTTPPSSHEFTCVQISISNSPKLRSIDATAFEGQGLCNLDLSYNQLQTIPQELANWDDVYGGVNLQGNPLNCSCSEQWLIDEFLPILYRNAELQYLLTDLRCAAPAERHNKRLIKYLNHRGAFCGGAKMSRLQMDPSQEKNIEEAAVARYANIICSTDEENCLRAHQGLGLIIVATTVVVTCIASSLLIILIVIRRRSRSRYNRVWAINAY